MESERSEESGSDELERDDIAGQSVEREEGAGTAVAGGGKKDIRSEKTDKEYTGRRREKLPGRLAREVADVFVVKHLSEIFHFSRRGGYLFSLFRRNDFTRWDASFAVHCLRASFPRSQLSLESFVGLPVRLTGLRVSLV